jgi:poly(A) polymerase
MKPLCSRPDALAVLKRLRDSGHIAYFAGGCVRDSLLGLEPADWDVATDAPPQRVRSLFPATQAVGAAFGVILVHHGKSTVEVATFRSDGTYEDGRRPSSVTFTTAEEDARRRDFTINGLFLDPIEDRVIDFVGGRDDLAARRIRAIGDPHHRFSEDHLRLLRAVRFAARFSFEIEPATSAAITSLAPRVKTISPERVGEEVRLMLTPSTRSVAWRLIWNLRLAQEIFRFFPKLPQQMNFDRSIFLSLDGNNPISVGLALAATAVCIHHQAGGEILEALQHSEVSRSVRAMRQAMRISNEESDEMAEILGSLLPLLQNDPPPLATIKRFLARPTSPQSRRLLDAISAVGLHEEKIAALIPRFADLDGQEVAPTPFIDGNDLITLGLNPGPKFRQILDSVYDAQLEAKISSKDEALKLVETLKSI